MFLPLVPFFAQITLSSFPQPSSALGPIHQDVVSPFQECFSTWEFAITQFGIGWVAGPVPTQDVIGFVGSAWPEIAYHQFTFTYWKSRNLKDKVIVQNIRLLGSILERVFPFPKKYPGQICFDFPYGTSIQNTTESEGTFIFGPSKWNSITAQNATVWAVVVIRSYTPRHCGRFSQNSRPSFPEGDCWDRHPSGKAGKVYRPF